MSTTDAVVLMTDVQIPSPTDAHVFCIYHTSVLSPQGCDIEYSERARGRIHRGVSTECSVRCLTLEVGLTKKLVLGTESKILAAQKAHHLNCAEPHYLPTLVSDKHVLTSGTEVDTHACQGPKVRDQAC